MNDSSPAPQPPDAVELSAYLSESSLRLAGRRNTPSPPKTICHCFIVDIIKIFNCWHRYCVTHVQVKRIRLHDHLLKNGIEMDAEYDTSVNLSIELFENNDPGETWEKALLIALNIDRSFDVVTARQVFDDVMKVFRGQYPGYCAIKTPYHDLSHTLNVFICAVRLTHGVHVSGTPMTQRDIMLVMIAALMHDIGYAQTLDEDTGTGAQFTRCHVERGISFMKAYFDGNGLLPRSYVAQLEPMMRGTNHTLAFHDIKFPSDHTVVLGQIVSTADFTGQMADRSYLEKLPYLYEEFAEAQYGGFEDLNDLLQKTEQFYATTRKIMDTDLGRIYQRLRHHFRKQMGIDRDYYLESIEKNLAYLQRIIRNGKTGYRSVLRRSVAANARRGLSIQSRCGATSRP